MNTLKNQNSQVNISVEIFTSIHSDAVGKLISNIQRTEFDIPITLEEQPDLADIPNFYQKGNGNFWIALAGDKVVGTIALIDIGNKQLALRKMFVDDSFRGSEYGTAKYLLQAALNWAKSREVKEIYLGTTSQFLAAHKFYAKYGFDEISKEDLPTSFPIMNIDTKFFRTLV